jgi:hypothetical protein
LISLVEFVYCAVRSRCTGKKVEFSGGCHGGACTIEDGQKQLVDGKQNCPGGVCHKTLQEPAAIAEGRPVHVATGMLPTEPKVAVATEQPMV